MRKRMKYACESAKLHIKNHQFQTVALHTVQESFSSSRKYTKREKEVNLEVL